MEFFKFIDSLKLKKKKINELECIFYFIPNCMKDIEITAEDVIKYFEWSEQGKHKELVDSYKMDGFNALLQGKRWRGIHIHEMYEHGILDGSVPYYDLLEDMPLSVVKYIAREIFKGEDKDLIIYVYNLSNKK